MRRPRAHNRIELRVEQHLAERLIGTDGLHFDTLDGDSELFDSPRLVQAAEQPAHVAWRDGVVVAEETADPDISCQLVLGGPHARAFQVLRLLDG